jgi:hypothetical protein
MNRKSDSSVGHAWSPNEHMNSSFFFIFWAPTVHFSSFVLISSI